MSGSAQQGDWLINHITCPLHSFISMLQHPEEISPSEFLKSLKKKKKSLTTLYQFPEPLPARVRKESLETPYECQNIHKECVLTSFWRTCEELIVKLTFFNLLKRKKKLKLHQANNNFFNNMCNGKADVKRKFHMEQGFEGWQVQPFHSNLLHFGFTTMGNHLPFISANQYK